MFENTRPDPTVDGSVTVDIVENCADTECFDPAIIGTSVTLNGAAVQIISSGDITITGNTLTNRFRLISASGGRRDCFRWFKPDVSGITSDSIGNPNLLVVNVDPDAEFLVETRSEFINLDEFISSDYFLAAIEYDPELKRFGDAYYR